MKQNRFKDEKPLCRFGPGGQYLYTWPPSNYQYKLPVQDRLTRVLITISDMINDFVKYPPDTVNQSKTDENTSRSLKYAKSDLSETDTTSASNTKSDQYVSDQQMLFADDCRTVNADINKPKHNVRTHRKSANKRTALHITGQGTFFDDNFKSAKSA